MQPFFASLPRRSSADSSRSPGRNAWRSPKNVSLRASYPFGGVARRQARAARKRRRECDGVSSYNLTWHFMLLHVHTPLLRLAAKKIFGLQTRDEAAMLVVVYNWGNTEYVYNCGQYNRIFFSKNYHENGVKFPKENDAFVVDHQHGRRDDTCKPAIEFVVTYSSKSKTSIIAANLA